MHVPPAELGPFATRSAPDAMVCTVDHLATGAGIATLRRGGTAIDAAVAASAVLAVTTPHMCGMGGDLLALVHAGSGAPEALLSVGWAGSGADADRLRAEGHTRMPFRGDVRSVPVPGCVDGWLALHDRYGRLPLGDVLAPAVALAEDGFPVAPLLAAATALVAGTPGAAEVVDAARGGPGARCRRPGTAAALRAVVDDGRQGFYQGPFGDGLLSLGAGEYTAADLDTDLARWVTPLGVSAWGAQVWSAPPPSQGYLALAGAVVAGGLELPADPDEVLWAHVLVEAAKVVGHDRTARLHAAADGAALVDRADLDRRRALIEAGRALALPGPIAPGGTIHLCVVDCDGTGVSLIQSNAADFGAHLVEPNTGTFLHNRGIGFSLEPGHPAEYGPRRVPPTTLSPALVTSAAGDLRYVLGTMGGDSQPQVLVQLLARLLAGGEGPGPAVAAGRWVLANHGSSIGFDTWADPALVGVDVEGQAPAAWAPGLERLGHRVRRRRAWDHGMGHAHVIEVGPWSLAGAADPRAGTGAAAGY